jgi:hypothetical protein
MTDRAPAEDLYVMSLICVGLRTFEEMTGDQDGSSLLNSIHDIVCVCNNATFAGAAVVTVLAVVLGLRWTVRHGNHDDVTNGRSSEKCITDSGQYMNIVTLYWDTLGEPSWHRRDSALFILILIKFYQISSQE